MSRTRFARSAILMASVVFACIVLGTVAPAQERGGAGANLPAGPGREVLTTACTACHNLNTVVEYRAGKPGWQEVVDNMILQGAEVLPEEAPVLIDYLAANLGPNSGSTSSKVTLPPGPGKEVVESRCSVCHAVDQAVSTTHSRGMGKGDQSDGGSRIGGYQRRTTGCRFLPQHAIRKSSPVVWNTLCHFGYALYELAVARILHFDPIR